METVMSSKGQVVIPVALRKKLGLRPGDRLHLEEDATGIALVIRQQSSEAQIIHKPGRKYPIVSLGRPLTSKKVEDTLAELDL